MGEVVLFPSLPFVNALTRRLQRSFEEASAEWKARGATPRFHALRDDGARTIAALRAHGLTEATILRRAIAPSKSAEGGQ